MSTPELRKMLDEAKASIEARGLADDPGLKSMIAQLERKYDDLLISEARLALAEARVIALRAAQP